MLEAPKKASKNLTSKNLTSKSLKTKVSQEPPVSTGAFAKPIHIRRET